MKDIAHKILNHHYFFKKRSQVKYIHFLIWNHLSALPFGRYRKRYNHKMLVNKSKFVRRKKRTSRNTPPLSSKNWAKIQTELIIIQHFWAAVYLAFSRSDKFWNSFQNLMIFSQLSLVGFLPYRLTNDHMFLKFSALYTIFVLTHVLENFDQAFVH